MNSTPAVPPVSAYQRANSSSGGGLARPGPGVQQHHPVAVEGPVQRQQRLIPAEEPRIRPGRQPPLQARPFLARLGLAQVDRELLITGLWGAAGPAGRPRRPPGPSSPATAAAAADLPLRVRGQLPPRRGHRAAERLPGQQPRVHLADEPGRGDDVDVVPHRHHPGHPGVHHLLRQRPVRPHPPVRIPLPGHRVRLRGQVRVRAAARVQHQHRHPGPGQHRAQRRAVHQLLPARASRVLEDQEPVRPRPRRRHQREHLPAEPPARRPPGRGSRFFV